VVVDYALRLKRELDPGRVWINAYANDAPCYIPSERVLKEGGYEGGDAMIYYDKPTRFRPGLEARIVDAVRGQLLPTFRAPFDADKLQGTRPLSPQQSWGALRPRKDMAVQLVAAEPLVVDPVAIDFGPDGRLWVVEMCDYPSGLDGKLKPGGRVKVLEDTDCDGVYDKATVFLDGLPFPTGIKVWRKGVLICAAPDILYAEDSKGTGKADVVKKLYSGFATHNYQARVNGLEYGLDNWVHGSGGLFGGDITSFAGGKHHLANRDFRIRPDTGAIEPASGRAQQGRVRNDWGDWFGCDNTNLVWHYPLPDHYLRRNPHVVPPPNDLYVPDYPDSTLLYPARESVQMFKLSGPPRRVTSACGIGVYRDDLLGAEFGGNTLVCEPVNLLVHRLVLQSKGVTFGGRRAADEAASEFLASTDGWSRPVQARTGPDGALWVVDMYRLVIEHPQWIPPEDLAKLDVRAGHTRGRIYRVYPKDHPPRPIRRLDTLDTAGLVAALDTPNGPQRDLVQQMLVWRQEKAAVPLLKRLAGTSSRAATRLQALCTLDGLHALRPAILTPAASDPYAGVRRHAVRLAEHRLGESAALADAVLKAANDPDPQVRLQVAFSLGEWHDGRAAQALASLLVRHADDPYLAAAVYSSLNAGNIAAVTRQALADAGAGAREEIAPALLGLATALGDGKGLRELLGALLPQGPNRWENWQLAALAGMLDALDRRPGTSGAALGKPEQDELDRAMARARSLVADTRASEAARRIAVRLLGRRSSDRPKDVALLAAQLVPQNPAGLQTAAVSALARINDDRVPSEVFARWTTLSPTLRAQALDALLSRDAWLRAVIAGLEKGQIPASQIDAARRQILLRHRDVAVRERAARLFAGATNADRKKVLEEYQSVLTSPGDRTRGKAVFTKRCATCHQLDGVGHVVGPDLGSVANKSPAALLIAILDPNQAVDTRYVQYLASTRDGRVFTGILASEAANSITLRAQDGKDQVLLRRDLEELQSTGKSLMPEGLEKDLSRQDLADVIAYLGGSGPPRKQLPGNQPTVIRPGRDGVLVLPAVAAEVYGDQITLEDEFRNIGYWHGEGDHVVWTVRLERPGRYDVHLDYACADGSAGNRFVLESGTETVRGRVNGTGGWDRYRQLRVGMLTLSAGTHRLSVRPEGKLAGALFDLRAVRLVPTK
jgi:putative membrane-bound dehydrogenase-like protein